jgi:hypothetical protein
MLNFDELVESTLISVEFNASEKTVRFSFRTANTSHTEDTSFRLDVVASGVESLLGDTLREINIVDFVEVHSEVSPSDDALIEDLTYLHQGGETSLMPPRLKNQVKDVRSGRMILVKFVPVCGALFMVLARRVSVEKMRS